MAKFFKQEPQPVMVLNRQLVCPVCGNKLFTETRAQMNTALASFFNLDWANRTARCYVCSGCTYVFWFRG
ncbi:MAG: hypothetical protein EHM46_05165 [Bacteroidetes bacterium]|nr:MAG: hypothetical protein EHM46_05165 [Bacteroidota bacterium]